MDYTLLTGTGVTVSRLCLGTMTFGSQVDEQAGCALVRQAFDAGITFVDTADVYEKGASEIITGKAVAGMRDKIFLASKVGSRMQPGPNGDGLSRSRIIAMLEASLRRLQTDYLDLYYLHKPDLHTPLEETLQTMDMLVRSGRVRYIGVSNFAAWQLEKLLWLCDKHGWIAPTVTQNIHNLITRNIERELVPCLQAEQRGLVVYSPLASGMLTGKHKPGTPEANTRFSLNKQHFDRFWTDYNFAAVGKLQQIAADNNMTLPEMALRWCLSQPATDCVIIGVSRADQLASNIAYADAQPLSADLLQQCNAVWAELDDKSFQYNR